MGEDGTESTSASNAVPEVEQVDEQEGNPDPAGECDHKGVVECRLLVVENGEVVDGIYEVVNKSGRGITSFEGGKLDEAVLPELLTAGAVLGVLLVVCFFRAPTKVILIFQAE